MTAAVLSIGTELVRGEIVNTNASWLCDRITSLGLPVSECATVPDDPHVIGQTIRRLAQHNRVLVSTGGLGPTTDDLTSAAVASELGVPLVRDLASLEKIRSLFTRAATEFSASNAKQADFPQAATVLSNNWGTAPGFAVDVAGCRAFFLPGVPKEMQPMFDLHIVSVVGEHLTRRMSQVRMHTIGAAESAINDQLSGIEAQFDVSIGYRAHSPEIEVKALAYRDQIEDAERAAQSAAAAITDRLGKLVYGFGDDTLAEVVGRLLAARGWTLALAESCTGGLISELITNAPASHYFVGGVVAYANDVKVRALGVPQQMLDTHGAVSDAVACALAQGVRTALNSDVGVAVSGICGPSGGSTEKPVGLVHWAVSTPLGIQSRQRVFPGDRARIRRSAAFAALDLLRRELQSEGNSR